MRTSQETLDVIHHQLQCSVMQAGMKPVETSLRATGVKDPLANVVIQQFLRLGIDSRKGIKATEDVVPVGASKGKGRAVNEGELEAGGEVGAEGDAQVQVEGQCQLPKLTAKKTAAMAEIDQRLEDLLRAAMERDPINPLLTTPGTAHLHPEIHG